MNPPEHTLRSLAAAAAAAFATATLMSSAPALAEFRLPPISNGECSNPQGYLQAVLCHTQM